MKKFLFTLLVSCFLFSLSSFKIAEVSPNPAPELGTVINGNFPILLPYELERGCEGVFSFNVILANLDLFSPNIGTDTSGVFYLPTGYPEMILNVNFPSQGISINQPVTTFYYSTTTSSGIEIFYSTVFVEVDFSEDCSGNYEEVFFADWNAAIFIDNEDSPSTSYPICNAMGTGDIFDCAAFDYGMTCPIPNCDDSVFTTYDGTLEIQCNDCYMSSSRSEENSDTDYNIDNFTINPNPFQDQLEVKWESETKIPQRLELFDINGRMINAWNNLAINESMHFYINTGNLSKGLYFAKVTFDDNSSEAIKLVKQ